MATDKKSKNTNLSSDNLTDNNSMNAIAVGDDGDASLVADGQISGDDKTTASNSEAEPVMIPVKLTILNKPYKVNCPEDEQEALLEAAHYIDGFISDIYQQAPHLSHENLLVLCCLNLYEQMTQAKHEQELARQTNDKVHALLDKMIKQMGSTAS